jgi:UDP-N-acetylmuramoylalanine--D-glutamate ligase
MELAGRSVVIVGLGKSGVAAARLCRARGASVVATDRAPLASLSAEAGALDAALVTGGHEGVEFEHAGLIVVSPGVPEMEPLGRAAARGVEVIGELELASRFLQRPIVAVGGTNGKSTTTTAIAAIFEAAGRKVFAGGNLGTPLSEAVGRNLDVLVVEVSSFQLERAPTFAPAVSVLLNVTDDHLDRYADFSAYAAAKGNAFANQTSRSFAVIPVDDAVCRAQAERGTAVVVTFGPGGDYDVVGRTIVERRSGRSWSLEGTDFSGKHNARNAAAALAATRALGVEAEAALDGLRRFRALPHRMACVAEIASVRYYDDSKATNVGAAVTALAGLDEERAVLIAGGRDKMGSYRPLVEALVDKGRAVVVIGEAADRIRAAVDDAVPVVGATSMDDAVAMAATRAQPGDAVLLSPACSSFDWYSGYAERGEAFTAAVQRLRTGKTS